MDNEYNDHAWIGVFLIGTVALLGALVMIYGDNQTLTSPTQVATMPISTEVKLPESTNYAVDTANVLNAVQLSALNAKLKGLDSGKQQIAVLIVPTTGDLSIEEYGIKIAEKWKVGHGGLDNGAIVLVAVNDHKDRIEVGYGLEGSLNDAKAGAILESMKPILRAGDYNGAVNLAVDLIAGK